QRSHGSLQLAIELYRNALNVRRKHQPGTEFVTLHELGKTYVLNNQCDEGDKCFREAVELISKDYYAEHPLIAPILDDWTYSCIEQGKLVEASNLGKKSLEITQKSLLPQDTTNIETMRTLAEIERRLEKYDE